MVRDCHSQCLCLTSVLYVHLWPAAGGLAAEKLRVPAAAWAQMRVCTGWCRVWLYREGVHSSTGECLLPGFQFQLGHEPGLSGSLFVPLGRMNTQKRQAKGRIMVHSRRFRNEIPPTTRHPAPAPKAYHTASRKSGEPLWTDRNGLGLGRQRLR